MLTTQPSPPITLPPRPRRAALHGAAAALACLCCTTAAAGTAAQRQPSPALAGVDATLETREFLEEEIKLTAPSSGTLAVLAGILTMESPPELRDYRVMVENPIGRPVLVEDTYYDTDDGALARLGHSYRLRVVRVPSGKVNVALHFKELVHIEGSRFDRKEYQAYLALDTKGDIESQASAWVHGGKPSKPREALARVLGREPELKPALTLRSRRAELLLYPRDGDFWEKYVADVFLDHMTVERGGRAYEFSIVEVETGDDDVPEGSKTALRAECLKAVAAMAAFLENEPRLGLRRTTKNKYQLAREALP